MAAFSAGGKIGHLAGPFISNYSGSVCSSLGSLGTLGTTGLLGPLGILGSIGGLGNLGSLGPGLNTQSMSANSNSITSIDNSITNSIISTGVGNTIWYYDKQKEYQFSSRTPKGKKFIPEKGDPNIFYSHPTPILDIVEDIIDPSTIKYFDITIPENQIKLDCMMKIVGRRNLEIDLSTDSYSSTDSPKGPGPGTGNRYTFNTRTPNGKEIGSNSDFNYNDDNDNNNNNNNNNSNDFSQSERRAISSPKKNRFFSDGSQKPKSANNRMSTFFGKNSGVGADDTPLRRKSITGLELNSSDTNDEKNGMTNIIIDDDNYDSHTSNHKITNVETKCAKYFMDQIFISVVDRAVRRLESKADLGPIPDLGSELELIPDFERDLGSISDLDQIPDLGSTPDHLEIPDLGPTVNEEYQPQSDLDTDMESNLDNPQNTISDIVGTMNLDSADSNVVDELVEVEQGLEEVVKVGLEEGLDVGLTVSPEDIDNIEDTVGVNAVNGEG